MPHNGARGSPVTDLRQGWLAIIIAAATLVSSETCTERPFTVMEKLLLIDNPHSRHYRKAMLTRQVLTSTMYIEQAGKSDGPDRR
ncbi:MAG TPA: hypothetical protein VGI45_27655 [Terracidiphilus sp.]|jgi:hypothetical protein